MKRSTFVILGLAVLAVATFATAQDEVTSEDGKKSPKALEILKKADDAAKSVNAIRYKVVSEPSGIATNFVQRAEGTAVMVGWSDMLSGPAKFYADIKTSKNDQPTQLTGGGDGESFFVIDHADRKAYEDMDPGVMGSYGTTFRTFGMNEFVHKTPFDDEIGAEKVMYEGLEKTGGEECHKIKVVYANNRGGSTWFISTEDYLPRRRIRDFSSPQGEGSLDIRVSELQINPRIDPGMFKMKLPAGFEQVDDFAP